MTLSLFSSGLFVGVRPRTVCLLLVAVLATCSAFAQSYPVAETYIGFTVLNNPYGTDRHNSPGAQFSFAYNAHRNLRLFVDFGAQYHSTNIVWTNGKKADTNDYQLLFGPELAFRSHRKATPFVHALLGVAFRHYAVPAGTWTCTGLTCYQDHIDIARETGFATGLGGGLDWHVHPIMSVRLVQFDWIRSDLSRDNPAFSPAQSQFPILKGWQDNFRISGGVTFAFGRKGHEH